MSTEIQHEHQGEEEAIFPSLQDEICILLAGIDTVQLSLEQEVSEDMYYRLLEEQQRARDIRKERNAVYVSPWLNAEMRPGGANGFVFLIETPDFAVKVPTKAVRAFCEQTERKARRMFAYEQAKRAQGRKRLKPTVEIKYLESLEQLAAMAGGIFSTIGVMGQRFPVVADMTDVLCAVGEELDEIAKYKGGVQQMLYDKWCKAYKVLPPRAVFRVPQELES